MEREEAKLTAEIKKEAAKGTSQKALKTLAGNLVQASGWLDGWMDGWKMRRPMPTIPIGSPTTLTDWISSWTHSNSSCGTRKSGS